MILKTINGGDTWITQTSGSSAWLNAVHFTDVQKGWAVGIYGTILKTSNGGMTWTAQSSGNSNSLHATHFNDAQVGWVVGESGTILKTNNGGTAWTVQNTGTSNLLSAIHFIDAQKGWIVGESGTILKTTNGGTAWTTQISGTSYRLSAIYFIDAQTGWAVGDYGIVLKTNNGGVSWTEQSSGTSNYLSTLYFTNAQTGWAVGDHGIILKTNNGGADWAPQSSGTSNYLSAVHFTDAQTGWAVGKDGTIIKTNNGGTTWVTQESGASDYLYATHFIDAQKGWVVGESGTILKTSNGGATWTAQRSGTRNLLSDVHFISAQIGWAVGSSGTILKYTPSPPSCLPTIPLHQQTDVPTTTKITWPNTPGCEDAHRLSLGTTPGGSDLLNNQIVADTTYQPAQPLPAGKTIYVRITPFNGVGEASGCQEFSFTTASNCPNPPTPTITGPTGLCTNQSILLDAGSGYSQYAWTAPGGITSSNPQLTANAAGTYTVTVTDAAGCTGTATKAVQAYPVLGASLANTQPAACNQANGSITALPLNGGGSYSFQWADLSGSGQPGQRQNVVAGPYTVTVTDANGCTAVASGTLPQVLGPTLAANATATTCAQDNGSITLSISNGTPVFTFDWADLSGPNEPQDRNNLPAGTYTLSVTDARGCTATLTEAIAPSQPGATTQITGPTALCDGKAVTLDAGAGFSQYLWSTGATTQTINVSEAKTYTVTITSAAGCTGTAIQAVLPFSVAPVPDITGPLVLCFGGTTLNVTAGFARYLWSSGDTTAAILAVQPNTAYTVTVTDFNGCTGTNTHDIGPSMSELVPDITGPTALCSDGTTLAAPDGFVYAWSNGLVTPAIAVTQSGAYTVTVTNVLGCTGTASVVVGGPAPSPVPDITGPLVLCSGSATLATNEVYAQYQWSNNQTSPEITVVASGNYTVTVTDANGCKGTDAQYVGPSQSAPAPQITGPLVLCSGSATLATNEVYAQYQWSNNQTASEITVAVPGNYTVTVTDTNGCTATATRDLGLSTAAPTVSIGGSVSICGAQPAQLSASGTNISRYEWAGPGGFTANSQQPTASSPGIYTVTAYNAADCPATATATVSQQPAVTASLSTPQGLLLDCQLIALPLQASGGDTYAWVGPGGFTSSSQQPSVSIPGTYTATVSDSGTGCADTASITISQDIALPGAAASVVGSISCAQPTAALQGSSPTSGVAYAWVGPCFSNNSQNQQNAVVCAPGAYVLSVTASNGCISTASVTVAGSGAVPVASAAGGAVDCQVDSVTLSANSSIAGSGYDWAGPNGFTANGQQQTAKAPGTYTVTVTASPGCSATATATVADNRQLPNISAAGGILPCSPQTLTLQGASSTPNVGYAWAGPNGFTDTIQQPTVNTPGTYTLSVTDGTCVSTATVSVTFAAPFSASIAGAQPICPGQSATLMASGGNTYQWKKPDGSTATGPTLTASSLGIYTCTATDMAGCTATATAEITAGTPPNAAISGAKPICPGQSVLLTASGGTGYKWQNGSNTADTVVNQVGIYAVTVTDQNGCTATATANIAAAPPLSVSITGATAFCPGGSTLLTASGGIGYQYQWAGPGGGIISNVQQAMSNVQGTYAVTVTDVAGCTGTADTLVTQHPAPVAQLSVTDASLCSGETAVFTAQGGVQYQFWKDGQKAGSFGPGNTWSLPNLTASVVVQVEVVDANQCRDTTQTGEGQGSGPIVVTVSPVPNLGNASLTWQNPNACPETLVRVTVNLPNVPDGMYQLRWQVDTLTPATAPISFFSNAGTLVMPPLPTGQHTCTMLDAALVGTGCSSAWPVGSSQLTFNVLPPIQKVIDTTICYTQQVVVGGKVFNLPGMYEEVLPTSVGCDSTVVLDLKTVTEFQKSVSARFCPNEYYLFYGDTLRTEVMQYPKLIPSGIPGCSTRVLLDLKMVPLLHDFMDTQVCPGDSVEVNGQWYPEGKHEIKVKSVLGCDSLIIQLDVKAPPFSAAFFPKKEERVCRDVLLTLAPTVQNCPGCKYEWRSPAGASFVLSNSPSIFAAPPMTTTYSVKVTMKEGQLTCATTDTMTVTVVQPAFANFDTLLCAGEKLFGRTVPRDTSITIKFQTPEGCDSTVTLMVEVLTDRFTAADDALTLSLNAGGPQTFNVALELLANDLPQPTGDYSIRIVQGPKYGTAAFSPDGKTLTYTPAPGGSAGLDLLRYSVCPPNGCPSACDSAWVTLRLPNGDLQQVQDSMPNLITPNGDGENDVFDPLTSLERRIALTDEERRTARLYIWGRWGEVVYRPEPYEAWEGKKGWHVQDMDSRALPQGTYYYLMEVEIGGKKEVLRGAVNLLK